MSELTRGIKSRPKRSYQCVRLGPSPFHMCRARPLGGVYPKGAAFSSRVGWAHAMKKLRLANLGAALSAALAALVVIAAFFYVIPSPSRGEAFTLVMVLTGCAVSGSRLRR
jgi:hypothetical protein